MEDENAIDTGAGETTVSTKVSPDDKTTATEAAYVTPTKTDKRNNSEIDDDVSSTTSLDNQSDNKKKQKKF